MKTNPMKLAAIIAVLVCCAVATIAGFTVSAANHARIATSDKTDRSADAELPALKDGVWQAVYSDNSSKLLFIDQKKESFSIIDPEYDMGVPSRCEYDTETGIYKLQVGYEGNEERWRIIDNNGDTATVSDANSDLLTLYYISDTAFDENGYAFEYYSLYELTQMAQHYYTGLYDSIDGLDFHAEMTADGTMTAIITVSKNHETVETYTIDMVTARGSDSSKDAIDFSVYADNVTY